MTWQAFVLEYGWRARNDDLALIVGQPVGAILRVRHAGCRRGPRRTFADLFAAWHGRPPADEDWPLPRKRKNGAYEWLVPEISLLASLVGRVGREEIQHTLTERLRRLTGDPSAVRGRNHVQVAIHRIGMASGDVVGGLTTHAAALRVGRLAVVNQAIANGHLRTFRVGKRHVIPREEFDRWLAARAEPPSGWVRLASLAKPLGITSDSKLPEYAALGHIPDVVKVAGIVTKRGVWYIAPQRARQILADARAGRPLPWHGKPLPGNQLADVAEVAAAEASPVRAVQDHLARRSADDLRIVLRTVCRVVARGEAAPDPQARPASRDRLACLGDVSRPSVRWPDGRAGGA